MEVNDPLRAAHNPPCLPTNPLATVQQTMATGSGIIGECCSTISGKIELALSGLTNAIAKLTQTIDSALAGVLATGRAVVDGVSDRIDDVICFRLAELRSSAVALPIIQEAKRMVVQEDANSIAGIGESPAGKDAFPVLPFLPSTSNSPAATTPASTSPSSAASEEDVVQYDPLWASLDWNITETQGDKLRSFYGVANTKAATTERQAVAAIRGQIRSTANATMQATPLPVGRKLWE